MKNIRLLALILGTLTSSFAQSLDSMFAYYPMHLGDRWQYSANFCTSANYSYPTTREIVGDTVMPNGFRYWVFVDTITNYNDASVFVFWMRIDSSSGSVYLRSSANYEVQYDSLAAPDGWSFTRTLPPQSAEPGYCQNLGPATILGVATKLRYLRSHMCYPEYTHAFGLGLVSGYHDYCDGICALSEVLTYARINGVEYGTPTVVSRDKVHPTSFALRQNYPNPFNPTTTIEYVLANRSHVKLTIVNLTGQVVAQWTFPTQTVGAHSVTWSPDVPTGVYFYELETISLERSHERVTQARKMLLLK